MTIHEEVFTRIQYLLEDEDDWVSAMSTVVCELHNSFEHFHWTGFYRTVELNLLKIGPYQGGHGCLHIPFSRGVCGAAARTRQTQLVPDVHAFEGHIACASSTLSELVIPVFDKGNELIAVLDIDSDRADFFSKDDVEALTSVLTNIFAR